MQRGPGFVLSVIQITVTALAGLLFTPFLIMSLGRMEYGLYQLLYATVGFIAVLDFGLGSTITQFVLKGEKESYGQGVSTEDVITMCTKLYIGIALVVLAIVAVSALFLDRIYVATIDDSNYAYAVRLYLIMGVTTSVTLFDHALNGIETAYEKYLVMKGGRIIVQVVRIAVLVVLFLAGMKAMAIVCVDLVLNVLITAFDLWFCRCRIGVVFLKGKWNSELFRRIAVFSVFVFLQIMVVQVNNSVDRMLLGRFATLELVGLYGVAGVIYAMFNSFGGILPGVSVPQISRTVFSGADDKGVTDYCARLSRFQSMLLLLLFGGFALYGVQFISCWTGEFDAFQVWAVAMLITGPQILEFIESPIFYVMKAKELQGGRSIILICVAAGNVVLSLILLQYFPVYGCALGTLIAFIIGNNILANIYYHKKVGIIVPRYFKTVFSRLLPAWALTLVVGYGIRFIPGEGWVNLILKCVLYTVIYAIIMLSLGATREERDTILRYAKPGGVVRKGNRS